MSDRFPQFEDATVTDLRQEIRRLTETEASGGYHPLRKTEKHRSYYCLTGEKLDSPSNGELTYRLLEVLQDYDVDFEMPDPFDAGGPLKKKQLLALTEALKTEAADE